MSPQDITRPEWFNTLRPKQSFADFKYILLNENLYIMTKISVKFVPKGATDNKSTLVPRVDNALTAHRQQAITWANANSVY